MTTKLSALFASAPAAALAATDVFEVTQGMPGSPVSKAATALQISAFSVSASGLAVARAGDTMTGNLVVDLAAGTLVCEFRTEGSLAINMSRYNAAATGPTMIQRKARGTIASPAVVITNDTVGNMRQDGHTGVGFVASTNWTAQIVAATPSATDMQSRMRLFMNPAGSVTQTEMLRYDYDLGFSMYGANVVINQNRHFRPRQYAAASLPTNASGDLISSSDIIGGLLSSDGTQWVSSGVKVLNAVVANTTISVPAGWAIDRIFFANTTANVVTGGIKIGTTSGATDVVAAQAVGANALDFVPEASILKRVFSRTVAQTLFVQAVTAWNSASVEISFTLRKVF